MRREFLHRFEHGGRYFAIDPETCFCFECDAISWDVLEYYPHTPSRRIEHLLGAKHDPKELAEVIGELEWLRVSKSILISQKPEDLLKTFEIERGLKRLTLVLPREAAAESVRRSWFARNAPAASPGGFDSARDALALLLSRSEKQKDLHVEFLEDEHVHDPGRIADACAYASRIARLAGKNLTVSVCLANVAVARPPQSLHGHTAGVRLDFEQAASVEEHVRALAKAPGETLPRLAKIIQPDAAGVAGRIVVRPNHPDFGRVVEDLDAAGFSIIELDMDGAYVANPHLEPQSMLDGMSRSAVYYAERLLKQHYFRLDPIAALFWRIYNGAPVRRFDPAGTNELAVDAGGSIYPCRLMLGMAEHRLGFVADASLDEEKLRRFDDVGAATTSECMRCWARHLCGGGTASVHQALSGSFRTPHIPWCDAQRAWMAAAVCAFQALTSQGVHFDRVYRTLGRKEKPSLFTLARAALTMTIGVRPIEEADAKMLTQWENWNEAAYFVFNETGLFLATKYDREMDSLHPRGIDHELILIRKTGEPFGLLKIRPERIAQAAGVWIYFRDEADYASDAIRRGFRAILKEAGGQHALRRLTVPVSPKERGLAAFLEAVGFVQEGVLREALFLHGEYHDVALYGIATDRL